VLQPPTTPCEYNQPPESAPNYAGQPGLEGINRYDCTLIIKQWRIYIKGDLLI